MTSNLDGILGLYDYEIPQHLIAISPANPRDSARLLVYERHGSVGGTGLARVDGTGLACQAPTTKTNQLPINPSFDTFSNITHYLPNNAVLVFNQTKVIPARMNLKKQTGGMIEALYLGHTEKAVRVMASGKIAEGDTLAWEDGHSFIVSSRDGKYAILKPSFSLASLFSLLERHGQTPLPPYIKHSPLSEAERRTEYQTVYAKQNGSVAAPTAGLHFTPELLQKIKAHGCDIAYVTLHVNLGTFAPLTEEHLASKKLHEEYYEIDPQTASLLNDAKDAGRPIIAVGTTSVRTLESATVDHRIHTLSGITDIFIDEHDTLKFVDGLITNFHVPKSSLLMLVSAFTGRETLLDLYRQAIEKEFRFFSFGDGMLIV